MRGIRQDIRFALRACGRTPGFTVLVILTLALGIGANTAVFSAIDAVLLRPLPFLAADRLVSVSFRGLTNEQSLALAAHGPLFERLMFFGLDVVDLGGTEEPARIRVFEASPGFFEMLGVLPVIGRTFVTRPSQDGSQVLISARLWREHFAEDAQVVGRSLRLDGKDHEIIGVIPDDFQLLRYRNIDAWVPLLQPGRNAVARLRPGLSIEAARQEADQLADRFRGESGRDERSLAISLYSLQERLTASERPMLFLVAGASALVLLAACANLAGLLLVRSAARRREVAVRAALGAGRARIIRQFAVESLILAAAGAAAGLLLAGWGMKALQAYAPYIPRLDEAGIDVRVLLFTACVTLASVFLFGIVPAMVGSRVDLRSSLVAAAGGGGVGKQPLQSLLVIFEIALALTLTLGAGLLTRSFMAIQPAERGFQPEGKLTLNTSLPERRYGGESQITQFYEELQHRLNQTPGVEGAALVSNLPSTWMTMAFDVSVNGEKVAGMGTGAFIHFRTVSRNYFDLLGIPVLRGRTFGDREARQGALVAVVNQHLAERYFAGQNVLGRTLEVATLRGPVEYTVVGVSGDANVYWQVVQAEIYVPFQSHPLPRLYSVVQMSPGAGDLPRTVRQAVWGIDRQLPVTEVSTLQEILTQSVDLPRFQAALMGLFAALALLLALLGTHGTLAYLVAGRRREIGVRLALGAGPADIFRLVVRRGLLLAVAGVALGLFGGLAASRYVESLLHGISPTDPPTFTVVVVLLLTAALLACCRPAHEAMRVDPMNVLRRD